MPDYDFVLEASDDRFSYDSKIDRWRDEKGRFTSENEVIRKTTQKITDGKVSYDPKVNTFRDEKGRFISKEDAQRKIQATGVEDKVKNVLSSKQYYSRKQIRRRDAISLDDYAYYDARTGKYRAGILSRKYDEGEEISKRSYYAIRNAGKYHVRRENFRFALQEIKNITYEEAVQLQEEFEEIRRQLQEENPDWDPRRIDIEALAILDYYEFADYLADAVA